MTPAPTQSQIMASLRAFLLGVLPAIGSDGNPVAVVAGQTNRVPEVSGTDFVIMTPIRFERIETNVDAYQDCRFTGSVSTTNLTVSAIQTGAIQVGSTLSGPTVAANTTIKSQTSGTPGGAGVYVVSISQTIGSGTLAAGGQTLQQALKCTVQLDFHSANDTDAGDMANVVSTTMRDGYAVQQFANQSPNYGVVPLYADDARQAPFLNDQSQVEWRWVVESMLQANIIIGIPQQFADAAALGLVSVDATFPP